MEIMKLRELNQAVYFLAIEQDLQVAVSHYKCDELGKWVNVSVEFDGQWFSWIAADNEGLEQITSMLLCVFNSLTWGRENIVQLNRFNDRIENIKDKPTDKHFYDCSHLFKGDK